MESKEIQETSLETTGTSQCHVEHDTSRPSYGSPHDRTSSSSTTILVRFSPLQKDDPTTFSADLFDLGFLGSRSLPLRYSNVDGKWRLLQRNSRFWSFARWGEAKRRSKGFRLRRPISLPCSYLRRRFAGLSFWSVSVTVFSFYFYFFQSILEICWGILGIDRVQWWTGELEFFVCISLDWVGRIRAVCSVGPMSGKLNDLVVKCNWKMIDVGSGRIGRWGKIL